MNTLVKALLFAALIAGVVLFFVMRGGDDGPGPGERLTPVVDQSRDTGEPPDSARNPIPEPTVRSIDVNGLVKDSEGVSLVAVSVTAYALEGPPATPSLRKVLGVESAADGSFLLSGLKPGKY
ncbi:MAG: carboxypeptidase-like regulatory domain-containing protein, partial [Planctomycetota bacterium]